MSNKESMYTLICTNMCVCSHSYTPYNAEFWQGEHWRIGFFQKFDGENIDRQSLKQPVFAIQLYNENIERENFNGSLAKRQIRQYSTRQNFALYGTLIQTYKNV